MATDPSAFTSFLLKDYELKIRYLSDHFTRIWMRFNFFVAIQTALSVALFGWFKDKGVFDPNALPVAVVGAVSSLCWYCFGAQDRYLVELYRTHVRLVASQLGAALGVPEQLGQLELEVEERRFIAVGDTEDPKLKPAPYQWRFRPLSTTKLVAWFPILVMVYWLIMSVLIARCGAEQPAASPGNAVREIASLLP